MKDNVHDGHRDRMRERIACSGVEGLQNHEILEYLLYAFIPRRDTNEIAHALILEFGSLAGVFNADIEHLVAVEGMTHNAAMFLASLPDVFRAYAVDTGGAKINLQGRGAVREFLAKKLYGSKVERAYLVALDAHGNLIKCEQLVTGSGDSVDLPIRKVVDFALKNGASSLVIAHNHPSGSVHPSQQDFVLTRDIAWTLESMGVILFDHLIFGGENYFSFEESGKLKQIKSRKNLSLRDGLDYYE